MRRPTVTILALLLAASTACKHEEEKPTDQIIASVGGSPVHMPAVAKEGSPDQVLWREFLVVQSAIVHPLRKQLIESKGIVVTPDDRAAAKIGPNTALSDKNQSVMVNAMIKGAISGTEIKLEQNPTPEERAELEKRLESLRAAAKPDATDAEKLEALGPQAKAMFEQQSSQLPLAMADAQLLAWKADKAIYESFGTGRVVRRASPDDPTVAYTIPIDAYRAWLTDLEERDVWDLYADFANRFGALMETQPIDTVLDDPASYYASPPDLSKIGD